MYLGMYRKKTVFRIYGEIGTFRFTPNGLIL